MVKTLNRIACVQLAVILLTLLYLPLFFLFCFAYGFIHTLTNFNLVDFGMTLTWTIVLLLFVLMVFYWIYLLVKFGTKDIKLKEIAANLIILMCWAGFLLRYLNP